MTRFGSMAVRLYSFPFILPIRCSELGQTARVLIDSVNIYFYIYACMYIYYIILHINATIILICKQNHISFPIVYQSFQAIKIITQNVTLFFPFVFPTFALLRLIAVQIICPSSCSGHSK